MKKLSLVLALALIPLFVFGEDVTPLPDTSIWPAVMAFLGSLVSVKTAIIGFVALATVFFRTTIGSNLAGIWTLAVLYALSALGMGLEGALNGVPFLTIVQNAAFTGAALNSLNEVLKHLFEKKA